MLDFIKEKSYYLLGGTVLLLVIIIVVASCSSGGKTYSGIESDMESAAVSYFRTNSDKLPKEEGQTIRVTLNTLIDMELIKVVKDPKNEDKTCDGYVQVKKIGEEYIYTPFLRCEGSYEPEYLSNLIKNSGQDEYGNGIYQMDGEYVYRGDEVNNYVSFNNQIWRIMRLNANNETKIILNKTSDEDYAWETSYNIEQEERTGITTNYLQTNMRKVLLSYYQENFTDENKSKIILKTWCNGSLGKDEDFNKEKECLKIKENEYVGLMNISDYQAATLDSNCTNPKQKQCTNRNYLATSAKISTWTMNTVEENTYQVFRFSYGNITRTIASSKNTFNPVLFLSNDVIVLKGDGTMGNPYIIK